jgi:hypothetical protein
MLGNGQRVAGLDGNLLLEPVTDVECDVLHLLLDGSTRLFCPSTMCADFSQLPPSSSWLGLR